MNNTTTHHLEALLVDDGHEFAMVRKGDLRALLQIANADPYMRRYLEPLGALHRKAEQREQVITEAMQRIEKMSRTARKHGDERRQYMANNRALLATVEGMQESLRITREAQLWSDHYCIEAHGAAVKANRTLARISARFPAVAAWMGLVAD
jgi:hypothetical protein